MFIGLHNHTGEGSNYRMLDSTITIDGLFEYTYKLGHSGVAITEHETVGSHVSAIIALKKLKEKDP